MSDIYMTLAGSVSFDPKKREVNGNEVKTFLLQLANDNELRSVDVTLWPELAETVVSKDDFVIVRGKFTKRPGQTKDGEERTYYNLSAQGLTVLSPAPKKAREVANKKTRVAEETAF